VNIAIDWQRGTVLRKIRVYRTSRMVPDGEMDSTSSAY